MADLNKTNKKSKIQPKFTIEKLEQNCMELFHVSTSTFCGATYGMTGKYSIEEMKAHIESWKKKEVK